MVKGKPNNKPTNAGSLPNFGLSPNYTTLQPRKSYSIYFVFFLLVFFLLLLVIISPMYWKQHKVSTFNFMLIKMCLVKLNLPGCMACRKLHGLCPQMNYTNRATTAYPIQLPVSPIWAMPLFARGEQWKKEITHIMYITLKQPYIYIL
jgi:hypothetical protein